MTTTVADILALIDAASSDATLSRHRDADITLTGGGKDATLSIDRLRRGVDALRRAEPAPVRPDGIDRREWATMDADRRAECVSDDMRPQGVSSAQWRRMAPADRAASAMFTRTEEWDMRGSLSDARPVGIEIHELTTVARVMLALGAGEMEQLVRLARMAAR